LPRYSSDEIKLRNEFACKMFNQLEGYLDDFLSYVPLDELHFNVYSLKLTTIILEAGPELMSAFDVAVASTRLIAMWEWMDPTLQTDRDKLWSREEKLKTKNRSLTFNNYCLFLNSHGGQRLDSAKVEIINFNAYFMPFEKEYPEWWKTYNLLKHEKYNNLKKATLETTLKLLGALFWLVDYNTQVNRGNRCQSHLFKAIDDSRIEASLRRL